ncbi:hypothetical protein K437DRAFT_254440 [Tilletiaria anomala UBC 951]|uniref:WW domain-containing protein n=1 Tax=Tilletiaria anomala (strain ATCC 24038 / CBS 436.72 / UBC 951) TaxID=1037660 RepID=A0A066WML3_TILAU|nr:uncharacterized protein K437DRAFT_254440 [Tilletiaria anomala UBC 951]KDN52249.1 hypothetical protein K437DRAFT_254440 [Tilletiaria anomala UBC 951]
MSAPPSQPPLPQGWTQHVGPQGQIYYWHKETKTSTYKRPGAPPPASENQAIVPRATPAILSAATATTPPTGVIYIGPPPGFHAGNGVVRVPASNQAHLQAQAGPSQKKEKPKHKAGIPGAEGWLRITTNLGNVFYTHIASKHSEWTVPADIKDAVRSLERSEREARAASEKQAREEAERQAKDVRDKQREETKRSKEDAELQAKEEAERIEREYREAVKKEMLAAAEQSASERKRNREDRAADDDAGSPDGKKPRIQGGDEMDEDEDEDREEDEEAWQRRIAAEMAAEITFGTALPKSEAAAPSNSKSVAPQSPPDEGSTLTKPSALTLLNSLLTSSNGSTAEVDPMAPFELELPKFSAHPDYAVISRSLPEGEREDAFNEWCKHRIKEKRAERAATKASASVVKHSAAPLAAPEASSATSAEQTSSEARPSLDAKSAYEQLLTSEVTSTRTKWEAFRKSFKKDRRFFAFGRDDREREKIFKTHLRELGEVKRRKAEQADRDFVCLLGEKVDSKLKENASAILQEATDKKMKTDAASEWWSKGKKTPGLDTDPRYDAVGSSSRRAELWRLWLLGEAPVDASASPAPDEANSNGVGGSASAATATTTAAAVTSSKAKDTSQALKEREEKVRAEKAKLASQAKRALSSAAREESLMHFNQLLIDVVRNPLADFRSTLPRLHEDARFEAPGLSGMREKEQLFERHITSLAEKRRQSVYKVFEKAAPTLDVGPVEAIPLVLNDSETERLNLLDFVQGEAERYSRRPVDARDAMEDEFEMWKSKREKDARSAFNEMLRENTFVEFWGRLRQAKNAQEATDVGHKAEADAAAVAGGDEDEELEKDVIDMVASFDLDEVHAVLKGDARYKAFAHKPEQREEWIREHLSNLRAAKQTVHQKNL